MNIKLLIISSVALYTTATNASLQVSASSTPGTQCYSESSVLTVKRCYCGTSGCKGSTTNITSCQSTYAANSNTSCSLGVKNGYNYYCAPAVIYACAYCGFSSSTSSWNLYNMSRYVLSRNVVTYDTTNTNECASPTAKTEYACHAGYYTNQAPSAQMTCVKCPDGGTSDHGNLAITGCYISAGETFSDDTGSGTVTDKCSYQN